MPTRRGLSGRGNLVLASGPEPPCLSPRCSGTARMSEQGLLAQEGWAVRAAPGWHEDCGEHPCPPASNVYPLPAPLPRCHMGSGLQLGAPPTTQSRCRELPPTPSRLRVPSPGNRLCSGSVPALRRQRAGPRLSANGGICACALEAASGRGLGKTPSQAPQRGCSNCLGPEVLNVSSSGHPGVCVCLLWEGAGRCCLCDLGKEENQREPRSQHSEAGGRLWESGHGF